LALFRMRSSVGFIASRLPSRALRLEDARETVRLSPSHAHRPSRLFYAHAMEGSTCSAPSTRSDSSAGRLAPGDAGQYGYRPALAHTKPRPVIPSRGAAVVGDTWGRQSRCFGEASGSHAQGRGRCPRCGPGAGDDHSVSETGCDASSPITR
jgi:hypothetical protein